MNKKKLWIFGDSYGAAHPEFSYTYTERLHGDYDVKILADSGTSIDWSFTKLLYTINEEPHTQDVSVVFFLTDITRQYWDFFEDRDHWIARHLAEGSWNRLPDSKKEIYKKYQNFAQTFFVNTFPRYYEINNKKNISFLNMYAQRFEKIIIFPCFEPIDTEFQLEKNVTVWNTPMVEQWGHGTDFADPRPNHMPESGHDEMYNRIVDWMEQRV